MQGKTILFNFWKLKSISPISFSFLVPVPISIGYYQQKHSQNLSVMDDSSSLEVIRHNSFPRDDALKKSVNTFWAGESIESRESLGKKKLSIWNFLGYNFDPECQKTSFPIASSFLVAFFIFSCLVLIS